MMSNRLLAPLPALTILMAMLIVSLPAAAHHVRHEVTRGEAVVVSLAYGNGSPLAMDRYEVIAEGEAAPYQSGNTDAGGRIVFLPDRSCLWRVRVFSKDGHGADFTFEAGPAETAAPAPAEATAADTEGGMPAEAAGEAEGPTPREAAEPVVTRQKPPATEVAVEKPLIERFAGPIAGVGFIFGIFGLFALFTRSRR